MHIKSSKETRAKRYRESKILHMVRMHNVARDGHCRFAKDTALAADYYRQNGENTYDCGGESELAHLENQRRFKTRGMKPELRHTTVGTAMLCGKHHAMYDGRQHPRLRVELLSNAGADGALRWSVR